MPRHTATLHAALGGTPDEIEAAFYEALQTGDIEKLMACWADEDEIVCVHPGAARLLGPVAIRAAYTALLERGGLQVRPAQVVRVQALASSVHSVIERVEIMGNDGPQQAWVLATNVYLKTAQGWRMAVHHASPGSPASELAEPAPGAGPSTLH